MNNRRRLVLTVYQKKQTFTFDVEKKQSFSLKQKETNFFFNQKRNKLKDS
jgi:hypothetical protein